MYQWRDMTPEEKAELLARRRQEQHPWHSPPHFTSGDNLYHVSASCYEHRPYLGRTPERMRRFSLLLLDSLSHANAICHAWCVLPNHYHALLKTGDLKNAIRILGLLHGRSSYVWNGEEDSRGRKIWTAPASRAIRSERHFWASMNYVHHNAVHHGYVKKWRDWPFTSVHEYMAVMGEDEARRIWACFPVLDYGKGWDEPGI